MSAARSRRSSGSGPRPRIASRSSRRWCGTCTASDRSTRPGSRSPRIPFATLDSRPDVVMEVLGGLEPARSIVKAALSRGLPVVTANKSLLAAHGDELFDTAAAHNVPLLYEASVLAGVPFLGTFARRPLAREASGIAGHRERDVELHPVAHVAPIASRSPRRSRRRSGPDTPSPIPRKMWTARTRSKSCASCCGTSAGGASRRRRSSVPASGPSDVQDLQQAIALGGRIRPVIAADWSGESVSAFAGPAFVPASMGSRAWTACRTRSRSAAAGRATSSSVALELARPSPRRRSWTMSSKLGIFVALLCPAHRSPVEAAPRHRPDGSSA